MTGNKFAMYAELEEQLRVALNGVAPVGPELTKTARRKLLKAERHKPKVVHRPLVRSFAHVIVTCRHPWGGMPQKIDYKHTNCSVFEAEMVVNKMIASRNMILHVVLKREVCDEQELAMGTSWQ